MKIRLTEEQLEHIKENYNQNYRNSGEEGERIARQLLSNPNNIPVWRVFHHETEDSIFKNGYSSQYFGDGEGSYHGVGIYSFYEPYGARKRVGGERIGDKIMKCVLLGGFKDFLILDGPMAMKYYHSDDIRTQLNYLYKGYPELIREIAETYRQTKWEKYGLRQRLENDDRFYKLHFNATTGYLSKALYEKFKHKLRCGKTRGIVYNGENDPHASVTFDPTEIIPLYVTFETKQKCYGEQRNSDFDNWIPRVTQETIDNTFRFGDYYSHGERLRAERKIKDYTQKPADHGLLLVTLDNGRQSYYDIKNRRLISKFGFTRTYGVKKDEDGPVFIPCSLSLNGGTFNFFIVVDDGYWVCELNKETNELEILPEFQTTDGYDKAMFEYSKQLGDGQQAKQVQRTRKPQESLNEEFYIPRDIDRNAYDREKKEDFKRITGINAPLESVYHRTGDIKGCMGIFNNGLSSQFSSTECYGHGGYTLLTPSESTAGARGFGRFMIHAYVVGGFKNFFIETRNDRCAELARKYYGNNYSISDQLKRLIKPQFYNEIMNKYPYLNPSNAIKTLGDDIGKTYMRGVITYYGRELMALCCDWKQAIPYEYSTDDGRTWHTEITPERCKTIETFSDAFFDLAELRATGVIKDMGKRGGGWRNKDDRDWSDANNHPQYINGYVRVILKKNNKPSFFSKKYKKLISYEGFDSALNWEIDPECGEPVLRIKLNGFNNYFYIYEDEGDYVFTYDTENSREAIEIGKKPNGEPQYFTTEIYDMYPKVIYQLAQ